jgi:hypothetical protein
MHIYVDKLPEHPRDCLFSTRSEKAAGRFECILKAYIPEADISDNGYKPKCLCSITNCTHLKEIAFDNISENIKESC